MLRRIPDSVGTTKEPQKNTSQMLRKVAFTVCKKGIGNAIRVAIALMITHRPNDFRDL